MNARAEALRFGGAAAIAYGVVGWMVTPLIGAVAIDFRVNEIAELLDVVSRNRALFVVSNVLLIAVQAAVVPIVMALWSWKGDDPVWRAATTFLATAAVPFVLSGAVHTVFGLHVADRFARLRESPVTRHVAVSDGAVLHQLADLLFFVGIGSIVLAMVLYATRKQSPMPRSLRMLGVGAAVGLTLQAGWFFVPALEAAGAVGVVLQATWFVRLGVELRRAPAPAPA